MVDIQKYISSGVIEAYCLDLASKEEREELEQLCQQFPLIQQELINTQNALIQYVGRHQKPVSSDVENKILNQIENLQFESQKLENEKKRLTKFIQISEYSKLKDWINLIEPIEEPSDFEMHTHTLYKDASRRLYLTWITDFFEEDAHVHTEEKFFILKGTCVCTFGDKKVHLKPGSFIDVPVNQYHNLKVTSSTPIKMIISKRKVA